MQPQARVGISVGSGSHDDSAYHSAAADHHVDADQLVDDVDYCVTAAAGAAWARKLPRMSWPPSVRIDSGWNCSPSTANSR